MGTQKQSGANDICAHYREKGHWKRDCPKLPPKQGAIKKQKAKIKRLVDSKSLEIDNLDNLPAYQGREYLSGEFLYYLKENGIVSHWTPPGMPQLNGVEERRNRTLSDIVRFIGYPKETAGYYFYGPSEQNVFDLRNAVFLERGFPVDTRRDELILKESSEAPQSNVGTSSTPTVSTDNVPVLRRTYGEAMLDINSEKWLEAMKSEIESMSSNQVWTLLDRPKGVKLVGCKWVYNMDVKIAFLNSFIEEEIYIDQPKGFTIVGERAKVLWDYDFVKNNFDSCVYKKVSGSSIAFLVLYVNYILLIGNDIKMDRSKRMLGMTKNLYVEKVLKRFKMEHCKRRLLSMRHGVKLSKKQSLKTDEEFKRMLDVPYASAIGIIQYVVQRTRPDVAYSLSVMRRYQACDGETHWTAVKTILKYLRRSKDMFLVYDGGELILEGYSNASFQSDDDDAKS
ncbi:Retrovirus-related Pol polyprotein from transposon RE2 [Sesamum angolense]|uniref:Retrovirus-related Pol polyprotein from transposon RE2 n=1 Tax=Sesamum angolense TaxID=2727404 RepID=A0AAE1T724_9LAMI|nr:Retrovirus-related Pol polyprotein from transposon RE2 [Sesamum angolense]